MQNHKIGISQSSTLICEKNHFSNEGIKRTCLVTILGLLFLRSLLASCQAASLSLVEDGQPRAEIVISETPERTVRLAAQQLQDYVKKISGATLPIVTTPDAKAVKIYVGHSTYTDNLQVTTGGLKADAYRIKTGSDWIVLLGDDATFTPVEPWNHNNGDIARAREDWDKITDSHWGLPRPTMYKNRINLPGHTGKPEGATTAKNEELEIWLYDGRGSFNAVCGLLRELGVRWYMPGELGEVVPSMKTISLPQMDETVHPDFPIRDVHIPFNRGLEAAMWYMDLGLRQPYGLNIAHGLVEMTQFPEVFAAHPEWFAVYGGMQSFDPKISTNQLNYTDDGLFQAAVKFARAQFDTYGYDSVSIMPPDGFTAISQDKASLSQDMPERGSRGHLSDYVWSFVNRVALEVGKTNPGKKIICCAYGSYSLPPLKIAKLAPNVQVCIVGGRRPLNNTPEEREEIRQLRKSWEAKTDNPILVFENYPFTDRGWYLPSFQPHLLGESINATKGVSEGESVWLSVPMNFSTKDIGFNHFQAYFTARMYWGGKDADVDKMFREYCRLFYGPAAQRMQDFFTYCEANWRDMSKDKAKADKALELFAQAKSKADPASASGKRIASIDDYLNGLRHKSRDLGKKRGIVPVLRLVQKSAAADGITIDGKLDDAFWQNYPVASVGSLRELQTGSTPIYGTTFKAAMSKGGNNLYFAIRSEEKSGTKPVDMTTREDDPAMWMGDCIEIEVETQAHSYYQIAISPSGRVTDLDRANGKLGFDWDSQAEVATDIHDGYWTVEIRLPVTQDQNDPLHQIIGKKPTVDLPWYINVNRQRIRDNGEEYSGFSPTGQKAYSVEQKFAYLYAGRSHKFEGQPDDDYLNDIRLGDFSKAASREKVTDRQKSYALELAAGKERNAKNWNDANKLTAQIPIAAAQKTAEMNNLLAQGKAAEVIAQFGDEDIDKWPFWKQGDGYFARGQAYAATENGEKAVADYQYALGLIREWSERESINSALGQAYENLLKDGAKALSAYKAVFEEHRPDQISGYKEVGSVIAAARILTQQKKFDEALQLLARVKTDNLDGYWQGAILLARGKTLEAAGRDQEAKATYEKVLSVKSAGKATHKEAENGLQSLSR